MYALRRAGNFLRNYVEPDKLGGSHGDISGTTISLGEISKLHSERDSFDPNAQPTIRQRYKKRILLAFYGRPLPLVPFYQRYEYMAAPKSIVIVFND